MIKRNILLVVGIFMLSLTAVSASVEISANSYYPTPAEAGNYVTVDLKVMNKGTSETDAVVAFKESYPFYMDSGEETTYTIESMEASSVALQKFKIRIDSAAVEGDNSIVFQYKDCPGCVWKEKEIPITVIEAQTTFDVVLQELNDEGVYLAIANIGKNTANAVTVRIPEQDYFTTELISASIVGNLESGDYTLVGFQIVPKTTTSVPTEETDESGQKGFGGPSSVSQEKQDLKIQIDYTDPLGTRRTVYETVPISPSSLTGTSATVDVSTMGTRSSGGFFKIGGFWFWIVVVAILGFIGKKYVYPKLKKKK
ncbi:MAG: hypothetical protein PHE43_01185 [Candidatus Nanoarchaeia archaeon]|nr:hypothetical protein [Candidatus Nanoarchaeia archaeon]